MESNTDLFYLTYVSIKLRFTKNQIALLIGLAILAFFFESSAVADTQSAGQSITCEIALPGDLNQPNNSLPNAKQLRTVKQLFVASEDECAQRAQTIAKTYIKFKNSNIDMPVKFKKGPIESVWQAATPPAKLNKNHQKVVIPITYGKDFESEIEQFSYMPHFAPGIVNAPRSGSLLIRHSKYLQKLTKNNQWDYIDFEKIATGAIRKIAGVSGFTWILDNRSKYTDQRIYFDSRGWCYTLVQGGQTQLLNKNKKSFRPYLLVSRDEGETWTATALELPEEQGTWRARIEYNDGNSDNNSPPPVLLYDRTENILKRSSRLYLYIPHWSHDQLTIAPPILISKKSLLQENHSGAANSLVSTNDRIYIVYPGNKALLGKQGTPVYLVIINKKHSAVEGEDLIGFAGSAKDVDNHNIPGICVGTKNTLHVLLSGHHEALRFLTGTISGFQTTWTQNDLIGLSPTIAGGYTYGSLNCDSKGNVYITSRWAGDGYRFKLVLMHGKHQDEKVNWPVTHKVMVDPNRTFYGAWRQKLTLDTDGVLYLWYSYYPNQLTKEELTKLKWRFPFHDWTVVKELQPRFCVKGDRCFLHPMPEVTSIILKSADEGLTWSLFE